MENSFDARAAAVAAATPLLRRCHIASRLAGLLGVCVGLGVLLGGWACDIGALRTLVPGYPIMVPSTALGLFLCGTALWLDIPGKTKGAKYLLAQLCGGIPILIGVATLFAFFLGEHVGVVDRLMFPNLARFVAPGGMAVMSAVTFMLLGGGCCFAVRGAPSRLASILL